MATVSSCPQPERLQQLLLGQVSDAAAERMEQHLESCARCSRLLPKLAADDALVETMRTAPGSRGNHRTSKRSIRCCRGCSACCRWVRPTAGPRSSRGNLLRTLRRGQASSLARSLSRKANAAMTMLRTRLHRAAHPATPVPGYCHPNSPMKSAGWARIGCCGCWAKGEWGASSWPKICNCNARSR